MPGNLTNVVGIDRADWEFVIGGYVASGGTIDAILMGYFGRDLMYAGRVRGGLQARERVGPFAASVT